MLKQFAIFAAFALVPGTAMADSGNGVTVDGSASAQAVTPVVLAHVTGNALKFGRFTAGVGGTVRISAGGGRSTTGDVGFVSGSSSSADRFLVTGDPSRLVAIVTGSGTVAAGSNAMAFTTLLSSPSVTISALGTVTFNVGGTLTVGAAQPPGSYVGSYAVTVSYN